ncbi:hypothetical protein BGX27_003279 [Mortierella sp. AM989]|nr:hypothetical protein BGX27_003279 [Mortierella sp. AM989]
MLAQGTASQAQGCATKIVCNAIDQHTDDTIDALAEYEDDGSVRLATQSNLSESNETFEVISSTQPSSLTPAIPSTTPPGSPSLVPGSTYQYPE